ncbi:DUF4259 domain-containing protein [Streptomyces sp. NPDC059224]|uniref:DUF4259 domain-containing protein n=1 Tax=Streptomyces sp. NPDC059224 TaxID=3346775 RepID=UPI0036A3EF87
MVRPRTGRARRREPPGDRHPRPGRATGSPTASGPGTPLVADDLRPPAVEALDRVIAEASELAELWDETPDGPKWRRNISRIRAVLAPGPAPQENPLFDL